ncbi:MAG TPA: SRPBCC family protein [Nitriliruptorales bacterium]|nr:SRPBCC family protein [Nitriliruptorales bacterium]
MASTIQESIQVGVPVRTAYNQWTQFEQFPRFMEGVDQVTQLDDTTLRWTAEIGGVQREWMAEITEQVPDQRVSWRAVGDLTHAGVVTFHRVDDTTTRVMLQMEIEPTDWKEAVADRLKLTDKRVEGDLKRFKEFIETRGRETGAWRGQVPRDPM